MTPMPVPFPPIVPPPVKKSSGWKSKLGAALKAFGGVALGFFLENVLPGLIGGGGGQGMGMALGTLIVGDAVQKYGLADKQERTVEATERNTAAVLVDTATSK